MSSMELRWTLITVIGWSLVLQAVAIRRILRDELRQTPAVTWTIGVGLLGVGVLMFGLRSFLPDVLGWLFASLAFVACPWLLATALALQLGRPARWRSLLAGGLAYSLVYETLHLAGYINVHMLLHLLATGCGYLVVAGQAHRLFRERQSRAARDLALLAAAMGGCMFLEMVRSALTSEHPFYAVSVEPLITIAVAVSITATLSNMGFVEIVLDEARRQERQAVAAQQREIGLRLGAEGLASQLQAQIEASEALEAERTMLLKAVTQEVGPALRGASGVLHGLRQDIRSGLVLNPSELDLAAQRADGVVSGVLNVVDNVLVAGPLLNQDEPPPMQPIALADPVLRAMADLREADRARVRVAWHLDDGRLQADAGLLRLAVRNLLLRALAQRLDDGPADPASRVHLRVEQLVAPPRLTVTVMGPASGPATDGTPGTDDQAAAADSALGLQLVRKIVAWHGGRLTFHSGVGGGDCATMVLPVTAPDDPPGPHDGPAAVGATPAAHAATASAQATALPTGSQASA